MKTAALLILFSLVCFSGFSQEQKEVIRSIFFGGGSYGIDKEQARELRDFLNSLEPLEYYDISIISHTDNIGGKEFNQWLSEMRSSAVVNLLKSFEVPQEIIHYRNDGQRNPSFDNSTTLGRMRNRRVDIIFTPIVF